MFIYSFWKDCFMAEEQDWNCEYQFGNYYNNPGKRGQRLSGVHKRGWMQNIFLKRFGFRCYTVNE